jgi:hypothetical protein
MKKAALSTPLNTTFIDVGGYRRQFILFQMTNLVAAYAGGYKYANLIQDALRLQVAMNVSPKTAPAVTYEHQQEYDLLYPKLIAALEDISGCKLVQVGDLMHFEKKG